ncbi:hypothetical protein AVEN_48514-1, partial [Araneus ventricosus]
FISEWIEYTCFDTIFL